MFSKPLNKVQVGSDFFAPRFGGTMPTTPKMRTRRDLEPSPGWTSRDEAGNQGSNIGALIRLNNLKSYLYYFGVPLFLIILIV